MNKFLLRMQLQFFAEDTGSEGGNQSTEQHEDHTEQNKEGEEQGKTFTRDEVAKMTNAQVEKARAELKKEYEEKEAEREKTAKMNAEQKAEHERKKLEEKIADYERKETLRQNASKVSEMFEQAELPHDEKLIGLVTFEDEEETENAVEIITNYIAKVKKDDAKQATPSEGGKFSNNNDDRKTKAELAKKHRIIK